VHDVLGHHMEGMTGIEPAPSVWKTEALPLSYIPENHSGVHYVTALLPLSRRSSAGWARLTAGHLVTRGKLPGA
jgi:hypothetical protein